MRIHVDGASFDVDVTPESLAKVLCDMSSVERTQFFNAVGGEIPELDCFWHQILTNDALTDDGNDLLNAINDAKLMLVAEEHSIGRKWQE